jgi:hypothetical protein
MKPIIETTSGSSNINKDFGIAAMSTVDQWELDEVCLHLSAVATASNNFVVQKRSHFGSAYDVVILTQAMVSVADVVWQPDRPMKMNGKDRIVCTWTNDAGADAKTYGLQINYKA